MTQASPPYGQCLATLPNEKGQLDLTPDMQVATGRSVLVQSLIRRQFTPRGTVITSPNDCIDIRQFISQGMTAEQLHILSATIQNELLKDQRVLAVKVQVSMNQSTSVCTITENVQSSAGPFTLTISLPPGPVVNNETPNVSFVISGQ